MLLGAIADDFTGAADLASMPVRRGMRMVQVFAGRGRRPEAPTPRRTAPAVPHAEFRLAGGRPS